MRCIVTKEPTMLSVEILNPGIQTKRFDDKNNAISMTLLKYFDEFNVTASSL